MPSQQNVTAVADLKEKLGRSTVVITTDFTGLDVATLTALRRKLKEQGSEYLVVKNTLASLAAAQVGKGALQPTLLGPSGLVLGYGDATGCARSLEEHMRAARISLPIRGGVLGQQAMSQEDVKRLATLPSQPELIARLAGQMLVSISLLLGVLNGPVRGLATVLQRSAEKQGSPAEGGAAS